ncbi:MAG: hypothetical protein F6K35_33455 [Okeania sp. SIO2H7]|nr:hypothetical protein [Okeania sp. SIO2H7]
MRPFSKSTMGTMSRTKGTKSLFCWLDFRLGLRFLRREGCWLLTELSAIIAVELSSGGGDHFSISKTS